MLLFSKAWIVIDFAVINPKSLEGMLLFIGINYRTQQPVGLKNQPPFFTKKTPVNPVKNEKKKPKIFIDYQLFKTKRRKKFLV